MTKEQAKIEANFSLYMGYLKLDSEKQIARRMLKDSGCSEDEIKEFMEARCEEIKKMVAMSSYSPD